jgi:predicted TIM-barrel fold metal-dependent hydrolase
MPHFKVVDFHLHLPVEQDDWLAPYRQRFIRQFGETRWQQKQALQDDLPSWLEDYNFPVPEDSSTDCEVAAARWRAECEAYQLERVVFQTGGGNVPLAGVVTKNSDLFSGFAHHAPDVDDAAHMLEIAIDELGLSGYKIFAPLAEKPLADPAYADLFEVCHQKRLPVLVHFGILGGAGGVASSANQSPISLAEVAQRYPHAQFIVPHFGCGFTNDLLTLCWACPNIHVDTSGNNLWTKWTMENYTLEQLFARFYATIGPGRIIFGTDSEWFPRGFVWRYLSDQYRAVKALNWPDADIKAVFRDNALQLLGL